MIVLLFSFFWFTKTLFKFTDFIIDQVWAIYNSLFQHMKNWYAETEYKSHWKNDLQTTLEKAQNKFVKYYKQTENIKEKLYAIIAVLDSYFQMNVYKSEN